MSELLRKAETSDIPEITKIWQSSFGDEKEYIDFFLQNRFMDIDTLVFEKEGKVVSQLFLISCRIKNISGYYLYAAATDSEYRGQGIMASLLEFAESYAKDNGADFIFLVPGNESLYRYYERFGYEKAFYKSIPACFNAFEKVSYDKEKIVHILQNTDNIVSFDDKTLRYCIEEFNKYRGQIFTVCDTSVVMVSGDTAVTVPESDLSEREVGGMILKLTQNADSVNFDDIRVIFPKE